MSGLHSKVKPSSEPLHYFRIPDDLKKLDFPTDYKDFLSTLGDHPTANIPPLTTESTNNVSTKIETINAATDSIYPKPSNFTIPMTTSTLSPPFQTIANIPTKKTEKNKLLWNAATSTTDLNTDVYGTKSKHQSTNDATRKPQESYKSTSSHTNHQQPTSSTYISNASLQPVCIPPLSSSSSSSLPLSSAPSFSHVHTSSPASPPQNQNSSQTPTLTPSFRDIFPSEEMCIKLRRQLSGAEAGSTHSSKSLSGVDEALNPNGNYNNELNNPCSNLNLDSMFPCNPDPPNLSPRTPQSIFKNLGGVSELNRSLVQALLFSPDPHSHLQTAASKARKQIMAANSPSVMDHCDDSTVEKITEVGWSLEMTKKSLEFKQAVVNDAVYERNKSKDDGAMVMVKRKKKMMLDDVYPLKTPSLTSSYMSDGTMDESMDNTHVESGKDERQVVKGSEVFPLKVPLYLPNKQLERFLTKRELALKRRKQKALQMIEKSRHLDHQERQVEMLEQQANSLARKTALNKISPMTFHQDTNDSQVIDSSTSTNASTIFTDAGPAIEVSKKKDAEKKVEKLSRKEMKKRNLRKLILEYERELADLSQTDQSLFSPSSSQHTLIQHSPQSPSHITPESFPSQKEQSTTLNDKQNVIDVSNASSLSQLNNKEIDSVLEAGIEAGPDCNSIGDNHKSHVTKASQNANPKNKKIIKTNSVNSDSELVLPIFDSGNENLNKEVLQNIESNGGTASQIKTTSVSTIDMHKETPSSVSTNYLTCQSNVGAISNFDADSLQSNVNIEVISKPNDNNYDVSLPVITEDVNIEFQGDDVNANERNMSESLTQIIESVIEIPPKEDQLKEFGKSHKTVDQKQSDVSEVGKLVGTYDVYRGGVDDMVKEESFEKLNDNQSVVFKDSLENVPNQIEKDCDRNEADGEKAAEDNKKIVDYDVIKDKDDCNESENDSLDGIKENNVEVLESHEKEEEDDEKTENDVADINIEFSDEHFIKKSLTSQYLSLSDLTHDQDQSLKASKTFNPTEVIDAEIKSTEMAGELTRSGDVDILDLVDSSRKTSSSVRTETNDLIGDNLMKVIKSTEQAVGLMNLGDLKIKSSTHQNQSLARNENTQAIETCHEDSIIKDFNNKNNKVGSQETVHGDVRLIANNKEMNGETEKNVDELKIARRSEIEEKKMVDGKKMMDKRKMDERKMMDVTNDKEHGTLATLDKLVDSFVTEALEVVLQVRKKKFELIADIVTIQHVNNTIVKESEAETNLNNDIKIISETTRKMDDIYDFDDSNSYLCHKLDHKKSYQPDVLQNTENVCDKDENSSSPELIYQSPIPPFDNSIYDSPIRPTLQSLPPINKPSIPNNIAYVPHTEKDLLILISSILDIYWNERRCGNSWESLEAPEHFLHSNEGAYFEPGIMCQRAYKTLLFELVGEILSSLYSIEKDEEEMMDEDVMAGEFSCSVIKHLVAERVLDKRMLIDKKSLPNTIDDLRPILSTCVLSMLIKASPNFNLSVFSGIQAAKASCLKDESIKRLLAMEMMVEEAGWNDIDMELQEVKQETFEGVFQWLLDDTIKQVSQTFHTKSQRVKSNSLSLVCI